MLEGFHAVKHAIRFGGQIEGAWTADPAELELTRRLAPDVQIPVEVVDGDALRAVVPRGGSSPWRAGPRSRIPTRWPGTWCCSKIRGTWEISGP